MFPPAESLAIPKTSKVDASINNAPFKERVDPAIHLDQNEVIATAYLRAAQAYMLISMPTGTSTIFGAFQAIWLSLVKTGRTPPWRQVNTDQKRRQQDFLR